MNAERDTEAGVSLVRTGEKFALCGGSLDAWIQADPSTFVELEQ